MPAGYFDTASAGVLREGLPMLVQEKIERLHNAKVIRADLLSDALKDRIDCLTDEDIERLIEIADKLAPGRTSCAEIMLLF
jgi:hypothetical protein